MLFVIVVVGTGLHKWKLYNRRSGHSGTSRYGSHLVVMTLSSCNWHVRLML